MVKPRAASSMKVGAVNRCYRKILEEWASVTTILKGMLRNRKLVAESGNEDKAVVKVKSEMRQNIHSLPLTISEKAFSNINSVIQKIHDLDEMHVYLQNKPDPKVQRMHMTYHHRIGEAEEKKLGHKIPSLQGIGVEA